MANAKKCDRCGKYYDSYNPSGVRHRSVSELPLNTVDEMIVPTYGGHETLVKRYELCPDCARYLHAVLTTPPGLPPAE